MSSQAELDLSPGLACLKNVDTLLRCPICFDYLNISMMTKCSHNFCSLCIRKFLSYKLQCPICNTQLTEQDLKNNRILDDLVFNFQAARQHLSKANFDSPPISPKTPSTKSKTPRKSVQKGNGSVLSHFFQKRPPAPAAAEAPPADPPRRCALRACRARASAAALCPATTPLPTPVKEEPMDVEVQGLGSVKREDDALSYAVGAGAERAHSSSSPEDVKPVIKVECPVCSVSVSKQFINKHLDTCLASGEKKESLRSSLSKTRRPMGKLVYTLLSMQELKRRLRECHLSPKGSRDQMIRRHREFVQMYNAQCDALHPKPAEDIAKEVEANEKVRNQLQGKAKPIMVFTKNQSQTEIDELHSNYRKRYDSDFSHLIAQVRGRLETTRQTRTKQDVVAGGEDSEKTLTAEHEAESRSCSAAKPEDGDAGEEQPAADALFSASPAHSDVSISSSISDVFGPEPGEDQKDLEMTPVQKRTFSSVEESETSSPIRGKRRRKT